MASSPGRTKTQFVLADQAVVSGANFVMGLLLARYLGPAGYGEFVLSYNVVMLMAGVQGALIISPMMVFGATLPGARARNYFSTILLAELAFCVAFVVVLIVGLSVAAQIAPNWGLKNLLWPLVLAAAGFLVQDFSRRYMFIQNRARSALISDLVTHSLRAGLLISLGLALGLTTKGAFSVIGGTCIVGVMTCAGLTSQRGSLTFPGLSSFTSLAAEHWHFGKWLLAELLVYWCGSQLVIYVAAQVISVSAVGSITAAQNITGACNILLLAIENLVPSRAAQMYALRGEVGLTRYIRRVTMLGGAVILLIVAVGAIWAEFWLRLLYGSAYLGSGWIVAWWGAFYLLGFVQRPFSVGLRVLGHTQGIFLAASTSAAMALTLSYPLIRFAGVPGTMAALCLVQAAGLVVMGVSFRRTLRSRRRSL